MKTTEEYMKLPYTMTVRWSADDELFVARVKEMEGCTGHGDTEAEAIAMLRDNMRDWISFCLEAGDEIPVPAESGHLPSGKWVQRVPRSLHRRLVECAEDEGVSLNAFVTACLAQAVGHASAKVSAPISATVHTMHASAPALLLTQRVPSLPFYGGRGLAAFQCVAKDDWSTAGWAIELGKTGVVVTNPSAPYQDVLLGAVANQLPNHWIWKDERADDEEESYQNRTQKSRAYA